jgi:hypothetical protein
MSYIFYLKTPSSKTTLNLKTTIGYSIPISKNNGSLDIKINVLDLLNVPSKDWDSSFDGNIYVYFLNKNRRIVSLIHFQPIVKINYSFIPSLAYAYNNISAEAMDNTIDLVQETLDTPKGFLVLSPVKYL